MLGSYGSIDKGTPQNYENQNGVDSKWPKGHNGEKVVLVSSVLV